MTETASATDFQEGGTRSLWRHPAFLGTLAVGGLLSLTLPYWWQPFADLLNDLEFAVAGILPESVFQGAAWFALPALGFAAGVLASLSPCVLPLVPLNVAYIGAGEVSGRKAVGVSARFVLGAALALAVLGLAADVAGFLLIERRGPVLVGVGVILIYLGLATLEWVPLPFLGRSIGAGGNVGPLGAGAGFALLTSPCQSPLLGGVLAASAAQAVPGLTVVSMLFFAVGYTLLVFLAGVFGGSLVQRLRGRSFQAPRAAAAALLLVMGVAAGVVGLNWF